MARLKKILVYFELRPLSLEATALPNTKANIFNFLGQQISLIFNLLWPIL